MEGETRPKTQTPRWPYRGLLVVGGLVLLAWFLPWVAGWFLNLSAVTQEVAAGLHQAVGLEVQIRKLRLGPLGFLYLEGITVGQAAAEKEDRALEIPRMVVRYNPWSFLLHPREPILALRTLELVQPSVRLTPGLLKQLSSWQRKKEEGLPPAAFRVTIVDGEWRWQDSEAPPFHLRDVHGIFEVKGGSLHLRWLKAFWAKTTWSLSGWINEKGLLSLELKAKKANLEEGEALTARWPGFFVRPSGAVDVRLTVRGEIAHPLLEGAITFHHTSGLRLKGVSLTEVEGTLNLKNEVLTSSELKFKIGEVPLRVKGEVADFTQPQTKLEVAWEPVPPSDLLSFWENLSAWRLPPVPEVMVSFLTKTDGWVGGKLSLKGWLFDPLLEGEVSWEGTTLHGLPARQVETAFAYGQGELVVSRLEGEVAKGRVTGEGVFLLGEHPGWTAVFRGEDLQGNLLHAGLKEWGIPLSFPPELIAGGKITGEFHLENFPARAGLKGEGSFTLAGVRWGEVSVRGRLAGFYRDGTLTLTDAEVTSDAGRIWGRGEIGREGAVSLQVGVEDLDLWALGDESTPAVIREKLARYHLGGKVNFRGRMEGTLKAPRVEGELAWKKAEIWQRSFEVIYGNLRFAEKGLGTSRLVLQQGQTRHLLVGEVFFREEPLLAITWETEGAEVADLIHLAGQDWPITGKADGKIRINGALTSPRYEGSLTFRDGTFFEQPFTLGSLKFQGQGDNFELEQFTVEDPPRKISGRGRVQGKDLDLSVEGEQLDLERFTSLQQALGVVRGRTSFQGKISGTINRPYFHGKVQAGPMVLGSFQLDGGEGELSFREGILSLDHLLLRHQETEFQMQGDVLLKKQPTVNLQGKVRDGNLRELLPLVGVTLPPGVEGRVSGTVTLTGDSLHPLLKVEGLLTEGRLGNLPVTGSLLATWMNGELRIEDLRLTGQDGKLAGMGQLLPDGTLAALIGIDHFPLQPILQLWWPKVAVNGEASGRVRLTGTARRPHVEMAMLVERGQVGEISFDELEGTLVYDRGWLQVSQVQLVKDRQKLWADGRIVLPADLLRQMKLESAADNERAGIDLNLEFPHGPVDIFNLIWGRPFLKGGRVGFKVHLVGSLKEPQIFGEATVSKLVFDNGYLKLEDLDGRVNFAGEMVELSGVRGKLWGGELRGGGHIGLKGFTPATFDLWARVNDAYYRTPFLTGLVSADITLKGGEGEALPLLAGKLRLSRSTITLGGSMGAGKWPLNIRLNLDLTSTDDVRVTTAGESLNVWAYGHLTIGGTLDKVTLAGRAEAARGELNYFGTTFRIVQGSALFGSYQGVIPNLEVRAETRTEEARIMLSLYGPADAMTVQLSSDPPMSTQEILAQLSLPAKVQRLLEKRDQQGLREELLRFFDEEVTNQVFGGLEHVIREALQLDEFRIERGFAEENLQLRFGKYLVENLYVTYTRTVEVVPREALRFEYRLWPGILFHAGFDNEGQVQTGVEAKIRF